MVVVRQLFLTGSAELMIYVQEMYAIYSAGETCIQTSEGHGFGSSPGEICGHYIRVFNDYLPNTSRDLILLPWDC